VAEISSKEVVGFALSVSAEIIIGGTNVSVQKVMGLIVLISLGDTLGE
jgi:hypothetical protein